MARDLGALLSGDIPDPVAFFLEGKVDFVHKLKGIALHYAQRKWETEDGQKLFRTLLDDINNYRLVAEAVVPRMIASPLRNEFVLYWGALQGFYQLRKEPKLSYASVKREASEVGERFMEFIHKAEDLRAQGII